MADDDDLTLDLSVKKKKKSKAKVVIEDDQPQPGEPEPGAEEEDLELDLAKSKKKKPKKAKEVKLSDDEDEKEDKAAVTALAEGTGRMNLLDARDPAAWTDYSYDDLLDLVFGIMREKNPDMASGKRRTFVMKPPQVQRAGSKKTAFTNFAEICRLLKREIKHVLQYLMAELGTTGSIDGNQCLIVKGRFQQKHFENVLRGYIKEYVTCHTCRSSDTELTKDVSRLFFIQCKACGSRFAVSSIKSGFTAMVGKRAALRRAAEATAGK